METAARGLTKSLSAAAGAAITAFTMPPLPSFLHPDRVQYLNNKVPRPIGTIGSSAAGVQPVKTPVLYWMQVSKTKTRK